ncbi:hypothetical protein ACJX0J_013897 [Zea mays]
MGQQIAHYKMGNSTKVLSFCYRYSFNHFITTEDPYKFRKKWQRNLRRWSDFIGIFGVHVVLNLTRLRKKGSPAILAGSNYSTIFFKKINSCWLNLYHSNRNPVMDIGVHAPFDHLLSDRYVEYARYSIVRLLLARNKEVFRTCHMLARLFGRHVHHHAMHLDTTILRVFFVWLALCQRISKKKILDGYINAWRLLRHCFLGSYQKRCNHLQEAHINQRAYEGELPEEKKMGSFAAKIKKELRLLEEEILEKICFGLGRDHMQDGQ